MVVGDKKTLRFQTSMVRILSLNEVENYDGRFEYPLRWSTCCDRIDGLIGEESRPGILEISGEPGSGKTQIIITLALSIISLNKNSISLIIDTENTCTKKRIEEIYFGGVQDHKWKFNSSILNRIKIIKCKNENEFNTVIFSLMTITDPTYSSEVNKGQSEVNKGQSEVTKGQSEVNHGQSNVNNPLSSSFDENDLRVRFIGIDSIALPSKLSMFNSSSSVCGSSSSSCGPSSVCGSSSCGSSCGSSSSNKNYQHLIWSRELWNISLSRNIAICLTNHISYKPHPNIPFHFDQKISLGSLWGQRMTQRLQLKRKQLIQDNQENYSPYSSIRHQPVSSVRHQPMSSIHRQPISSSVCRQQNMSSEISSLCTFRLQCTATLVKGDFGMGTDSTIFYITSRGCRDE